MINLYTPLLLAAFIAAFFCPKANADEFCKVMDTKGDTVTLNCTNDTVIASIAFVSFPVEGQPLYNDIQTKLSTMKGTAVSARWSYSTNNMKSVILYRKGVNLNLAFIKAGWGYLSRSAQSLAGYRKAQDSAMKKKLGVWGNPDQTHPYSFIQNTATLGAARKKLKLSEQMKSKLHASFIADKRTKVAYRGNCQEYLSIPNLYKIVFFTERALKFKGYTLSSSCTQ